MQGNFINNTNTRNYYSEYKQYVVKKDDSLYKIAKEYNTTVEELISLNHLPSNIIYPNQILLLPHTSNSSTKTYLTKFGDSIKDILEKYGITLKELEKNNDIEKLKLLRNQLLYVAKNTNSWELEIRGNVSLDEVLTKYNLTPLKFLKLNESNLLSPGNKINVK